MAKADITLRITRLSMNDLWMLGTNVLAKLEGNPTYPDPAVPLPQMEAMLLRFQELIIAATRGSKHALLERNDCAREVQEMLTRQAFYVRLRASGNAALLATSGFPLRKTPEPIGPVPPVRNLGSHTGREPGSISLRWHRLRGARLYMVYKQSNDPEVPWELVATTSRATIVVKGLVRDSRYWFKVHAMGTAGAGPMSDPTTAIAA